MDCIAMGCRMDKLRVLTDWNEANMNRIATIIYSQAWFSKKKKKKKFPSLLIVTAWLEVSGPEDWR